MELPSYFKDFLENIRPTENQAEGMKNGHTTLRERLWADKDLAPLLVTDFLQGSYRRSTAIRPQGDKRSDVDIVVVTKIPKEEAPKKAIERFQPFVEKYYKDKYVLQGRSIGIELQYVHLDLVITAAPSESDMSILKSEAVTTRNAPEDVDDWKLVEAWVPLEKRADTAAERSMTLAKAQPKWKESPLYIPDRDANKWEQTDPIAQIDWTFDKNKKCNTHYVNVVKAIKWWRRVNHTTPKYPKGYPVEHIVGACCPDDTGSVAEGVTSVLENIASQFATQAASCKTPYLRDHGVEQNVFARVSGEDFKAFHEQCVAASQIARRALDAKTLDESVSEWQKLFGDKFPSAPKGGGDGGGGFTKRENISEIGGGRFA